jgi:hypothetical protein
VHPAGNSLRRPALALALPRFASLLTDSFIAHRVEGHDMFRIFWMAALPLAVLAFLAGPVLADEVHEGKVISVAAHSITIQDKDGDNETFVVSDDATITHGGKPAKLSDIDNGDMAAVTVRLVKGKQVAVVIDAKCQE